MESSDSLPEVKWKTLDDMLLYHSLSLSSPLFLRLIAEDEKASAELQSVLQEREAEQDRLQHFAMRRELRHAPLLDQIRFAALEVFRLRCNLSRLTSPAMRSRLEEAMKNEVQQISFQ